VIATYELESHHLKLLRLAAESWDRAQAAREALAEHGTVYTDRFGAPRPRPEVRIEQAAMVTFTRITREIGFDVAAPDARPPRRDGRN
jgi:phage terminase small subunit